MPQTTPRPWVEVTEEGDRILYGARLQQQGYAPYLNLERWPHWLVRGNLTTGRSRRHGGNCPDLWGTC